MSKTVVRKNESLDDALRRFKRTVSRNGTLQEYRKREFYEKPSVKRKLKSEAARKRKNKRRRYLFFNSYLSMTGRGFFIFNFSQRSKQDNEFIK